MGRGQARNNVLQDLEHVFIASGPGNVIIQIASAYVWNQTSLFIILVVGLHDHAGAEL